MAMTDQNINDLLRQSHPELFDDTEEKDNSLNSLLKKSHPELFDDQEEEAEYDSVVISDQGEKPLYNIDTHRKFKKADLMVGNKADAIREYMILTKGKDYENIDRIDNERVVDDFFNHMRWWNTNTVGTAGEIRRMYNANDAEKEIANRAYKLYDATGNVFVNDGVSGAIEGVFDYMQSALLDPTNYIGLLTGGLAKLGTTGATQAGKELMKKSLQSAGRHVATKKSKKEIAEAGLKAGTDAKALLKAQGVKNPNMLKKLSEEAAERESNIFRDSLRLEHIALKKMEKSKELSKEALKYTIAGDAAMAMFHDYSLQNLYGEVDDNYVFSTNQLLASAALGSVGGIFHYVGSRGAGASGLQNVKTKKVKDPKTGKMIDKPVGVETFGDKRIIAMRRARAAEQLKLVLNDETAAQLGKQILTDAKEWRKQSTPAVKKFWKQMDKEGDSTGLAFLKLIMMGPNGKTGIVGVLKKHKTKVIDPKTGKFKRDANGKFIKEPLRLSIDTNLTDVLTMISKTLPDSALKAINKELTTGGTGLSLGRIGEELGPLSLGNLARNIVGDAGQKLNVVSQASKMLDPLIVKNESLTRRIKTLDDIGEAYKSGKVKSTAGVKGLEYAQNIWRRLLVSSPATSAVNIAGYAQYNVGQTAVDILMSPQLMIQSGAQRLLGDKEGAKRTAQLAKTYVSIQKQKLRNFQDPFATREAYLSFLEQNPDLEKLLKATTSMGIETRATKFNIDPENKIYQTSEWFADAANTITGVKVQDTITKSQMFMTEMDKYLRLAKGKSLKDVMLSTDPEDALLIDQNVIEKALDSTLKSVFSKDYTSSNVPGVGAFSSFVEGISNTPVLGTVLPFGRFFNNVLATAYDWSPVGATGEITKAVYRNASRSGVIRKALGKDKLKISKEQKLIENLSTQEAVVRGIVGTAALGLAMKDDKKSFEEGRAWHIEDVGHGTEVDIKNVFPISLWKVLGRVLNHYNAGETIPRELKDDLFQQIAIGQAAKDFQFYNDLVNITDAIASDGERSIRPTFDTFLHVTGNVGAGVTRPLDPINKAAGFIFNNDIKKDTRQQSGLSLFTGNFTKYTDNIIEAVVGQIDSVTGEQLAMAVREGPNQDPNPIASIFGIRVQPAATDAERVFQMADMPYYKANKRTSDPAYDKIYTEIMAPILARKAKILIGDKTYRNGGATKRQAMLNETLQEIRKEVVDLIEIRKHSNPKLMVSTLRRKVLQSDKRYLKIAKRNIMDRYKNNPDRTEPVFSISEMNVGQLREFIEEVEIVKQMSKKNNTYTGSDKMYRPQE